MPDLISYLEKNGFYPRREDIEAILRRLDHDANRMLSYDEFCELASVQDREQEKKEDDFIQDDSKTDLRRANSGDAFNSPAPKDGEVQEEEGEEQKTAEQKKIGASKAGKKSTAPAKALKPEQTPARSAAKRPATSEDRKRREDSEKAAAEERQALQQSIEDEKQRLQEEAEQRERDLIEAQEKREREW